MNIRFAKISDLQRITDIYNLAIKAGNITADIERITIDDRLEWFLDHNIGEYPIYVVEVENRIVGWGALSSYRKGRGALRTTAEISYYVDFINHKKGYGTKLIDHMIKDCDRLGIENLIAFLVEINKPSIEILQKFGFEQWGCFPGIVNLNKIVCGHLIYGKKI
jgi:L-amino acid N-acyltransferase YncA